MIKITPKENEYDCCSSKGEKPKKFYPNFRARHEFFPETKYWKVGKTYKIEMEVKMTGLSISKMQNDSEFDIIAYDLGESKGEDKKEEKKKEYTGKEIKAKDGSPAVPKV